MRNLTQTLVLFCCLSSLAAQTECEQVKNSYDTATIRQVRLLRFEVNHKWRPIWKLPELLSTYADSKAALKSYHTYDQITNGLELICIASIVGTAAAGDNDKTAAVMVTVAVISGIASFVFYGKSQQQLKYSVWLYNRSVIAGDKKIVRSKWDPYY